MGNHITVIILQEIEITGPTSYEPLDTMKGARAVYRHRMWVLCVVPLLGV